MLLALLVASSLSNRIAERAHAAAGLDSVRQISRRDNDDCSGFVRAIYAREGIDLDALPARPGENGVANIRRLAAARRALRTRPRRGDLVFFRNTTQRRGLTHIGVVDWVGPRGEATFVHRAGSGIVRSRLDLRHPHLKTTNDYIRRSPPRLAGELAAGFASPDRLGRISATSAGPRPPPSR
jgi:cell wall-associated NlpC family hydrolase